jgi:Asp-tRNAAsn/Glu-tRNAGln amidotransferase A subunit and related amidases
MVSFAKSSNDLTEFYKHNRSEGFGKEVKRRIMLGTFVLSTGYYDAILAKAQKVRRKLVEKTQLVFNEFDFILMPTSPSVAFKIGEKTDDPSRCISQIFILYLQILQEFRHILPLFKHSNGMPFGVQLMAKQFNELSLLQASQQLMELKK